MTSEVAGQCDGRARPNQNGLKCDGRVNRRCRGCIVDGREGEAEEDI